MDRNAWFRPDYERYDGVRPIQIHLARVGYAAGIRRVVRDRDLVSRNQGFIGL